MYNQGEGGELLLVILTEVEKWGGITFNDEQSEELARQCPKAAEYNRAIMSALFNYITSVAKGMVEYGVENGFEAWRRFYHHYLPFAEDLQQILFQDLYTFSFASEGNIDSLLNQMERITELYTTVGRPDAAISEKWINVAMFRNPPKQITKDLAMQFRDTKTVNEVRNVVNIYLHDHIIGMFRGQVGPMLCMTEGNKETDTKAFNQPTPDRDTDAKQSQYARQSRDAFHQEGPEQDFNATTKGAAKSNNGGNGYDEC